MHKTLKQIIIQFPDIPLKTRDGHKLRGYFGNLFKEYSPLLHNHFQDGRLRYAYPLVQYKVINKTAHLIGLDEGAELLAKLFLKVKQLIIDNHNYEILSKNITSLSVEISSISEPITYQFLTPWLALNQQNYRKYKQLNQAERQFLLQRIIVGNILTFYKAIGFTAEQTITANLQVREVNVMFKNQRMIGFVGMFTVNAILPDYIGIGKSVSRGFGTIRKL